MSRSSDVGLKLERLIRSRDGRRLVAVGDQRVVDAASGQRLTQVDNARAAWTGHAFEAPSGLIVVTGGLWGPTNGSVWPLALTVSGPAQLTRRVSYPIASSGKLLMRTTRQLLAAPQRAHRTFVQDAPSC